MCGKREKKDECNSDFIQCRHHIAKDMDEKYAISFKVYYLSSKLSGRLSKEKTGETSKRKEFKCLPQEKIPLVYFMALLKVRHSEREIGRDYPWTS